MKPKKLSLAGAILALLLIGPATVRSQCKAADPTGYFEGDVNSQEAGELKVSLNLRCDKDKYEGEVVTPVGTFVLKSGKFDGGKLLLQFDAGGEVGTIEAQAVSGSLNGSFWYGGDSGTVALRRLGDPKPPAPKGPTLNLSPEQWREDLKFFATELPKRHANAFQYVSRERFDAEIAALDRNIPHLNGDQIYAGMDRIANMIGDGHTYILFPSDPARLPIAFRQFGDEIRVAAVTEGYEQALGARVVKIQDTRIERAREILKDFTPSAETRILADARIEGFLSNGMLLHGAGIVSDRNLVRYTFADENGKEFALEMHSVPAADPPKIKWISVFKEPPLYRQQSGEDFWYVYLPEAHTLYCSFRAYQNLGQKAKGLFELLQRQRPDKLVVDLRLNGGGDYTQGLEYLIEPIRKLPDINRKGHLFVIIGPNTFSAAMSNAAHFRFQTEAMLVGQTIGERPNSYQESREMRLPNSSLVVRYSTKFYKFVEHGENIIRPDKEIIPTWNEYKDGRDPVLEWILAYKMK